MKPKPTPRPSYVKIEDKNDMLSSIFGYASKKQTNANHKKITQK